MPPVQQQQRPVEERVAELEELLGRILTRAAEHPVGRKVLAYLGLS